MFTQRNLRKLVPKPLFIPNISLSTCSTHLSPALEPTNNQYSLPNAFFLPVRSSPASPNHSFLLLPQYFFHLSNSIFLYISLFSLGCQYFLVSLNLSFQSIKHSITRKINLLVLVLILILVLILSNHGYHQTRQCSSRNTEFPT